MSDLYEMLVQIDRHYLDAEDQPDERGTIREALTGIANWLEEKGWTSLSVHEMRSIAAVQPDPIDTLSPDERLGYAYIESAYGTAKADAVFFEGLILYGSESKETAVNHALAFLQSIENLERNRSSKP